MPFFILTTVQPALGFTVLPSSFGAVIDSVRADRDPMWIGNTIYFNSDRDGTFNLYAYDVATAKTTQVTSSKLWDVRWPGSDRTSRIIYEQNGELNVLDVKTGKPYWTYDMLAASWGSPLIVEDKIYVGDEDGDVVVLALSAKQEMIAETNMGSSVYTTPVVADNILYIADKDHLFAIEGKE